MWEQSPPQHVALRWLVTIGLILDLPLSLLADTFILPIDLVVKPQRSRIDPGDCNANPRSL
jgi:hypothetical protein